jgi:hypothetical protein
LIGDTEEVEMPFVDGEVLLEQVGASSWHLREPIEYRGASQPFTVPAEFRTDLASVPRPLVWLLPRYGAYTRSAILHDFLCRHPELLSRADADGIFRRSMRELGVPFLRRWLMWAAVRAGSLLRGATARDLLVWLLIAVPGLAFVLLPGLLVLVWMGLFWLLELVTFGVLRLLGRHPTQPPLLLKLG